MRFRLRFVIGTALVVGAIVYLITTAIRSTSEYYLTVNEVGARQAELVGQPLRVAGRVKPGTIAWDPSTLTLNFGIVAIPDPNADPALKQVSTAEPASYTVTCAGEPKPDMFADNRDVIVEGKLDSAGHITATQVLTSCPSKYKPAQAK
ncbi:MAG: cytochrome c maturation protein CcmE [Candidatus Binataceae bacterium]